ncbi:sensor histidine kinase [Pseudoduganella sp. OTU4001]|uniref:sensor histidine kinase n=1 Tax=Pseudoduganella sp. OTU4001 TaxID=3043854 RepID=UPI00313B1826
MHTGPEAALRQILSMNRTEGRVSAAMFGGSVALPLLSGSYSHLALFGALLLDAALVLAGAQLLRMMLPRGASWTWCWAAQPLLLLTGAVPAVLAYGRLTEAYLLMALSPVQMLGSALAFGAAILTIPLLFARRQARALEISELQRAAVQAELKSLQAQVEPHFLYNTLANTRYLVRHAPDKAVVMLDHLIAYLRTALPDMRTPASTLGRECELAGHYLGLMEIRFGSRLRTRIDCPDALREISVPPMMLMSLVENAVQHGVEPKPGAVSVSVVAAMCGDRLSVTVRDDGAGLQQDAPVLGSGVGLRNVRDRLHALYGEKAAFALRQAADGATEAELLLPVEARA